MNAMLFGGSVPSGLRAFVLHCTAIASAVAFGISGPGGENVATSGLDTIPDVRCAPLVESIWDQSNVVGDSRSRERCFNLYTPHHAPCGCTATVMAQLMRYWRYPVAAVNPRTVKCSYEGSVTNLTMFGGTYDWDLMPLDPNGATEVQREAMGRLVYDCGVAVGTMYGSHVSLAYTEDAADILVSVFGYKKASVLHGYDEAKLLADLDAARPVLLGLMLKDDQGNVSNGHEAIADGYGYDEKGVLRVHLNMGWRGFGNGWYALPDVVFDYYTFNTIELMIYNVMPGAGSGTPQPPAPAPTGDEMPSAACTYDASVFDSTGAVCGTIQLKAGKPNKKSGKSKIAAKIMLLGGEKATLKGEAAVSASGPTPVSLTSGTFALDLSLEKDSVTGTLSGMQVEGARNYAATKGDARSADYGKWTGSWTVALASSSGAGAGSAFSHGYSALTVKVAKKGKAKVKGFMADGTKISATGQLLLSDDNATASLPFVVQMYAGKAGGFGGLVSLTPTNALASALTDWNAAPNAKAPFVAALTASGGAKAVLPGAGPHFLHVETNDVSHLAGILAPYLPSVGFSLAGTKARLPSADKIKLDATGALPAAQTLGNPAGLKLSFKSDGTFKGSFKAYRFDGPSLKAVKATINGVMTADGGYGAAVIKGIGSLPVVVE